MSARARPRQNAKEESGDAHEERNIWLAVVTEIKKLRAVNQKASEISTDICQDEEKMTAESGMTFQSFMTSLTSKLITTSQMIRLSHSWKRYRRSIVRV